MAVEWRVERDAVAGAAAFICDIRLGLLVLIEWGLLLTDASLASIVVIVIAMGMSWIPLKLFKSTPADRLLGWSFVAADAVLCCVVTVVAIPVFAGAFYLVPGYVIASGLLVGLLLAGLKSAVWTTCVIWALVLGAFFERRMAPEFFGLAVVGVTVVAVYFGHRLRDRMRHVARISAELAQARASERGVSERLMIARDLHDSLAKSVHGIRMLAETLHASLESSAHPDTALSRALFDSADEASREARLVLDGLRIPCQGDLVSVLVEEVRRWGARTGVGVVVEPVGGHARAWQCDSDTLWQLQRIIGEILSNVEKHAQAETVRFKAQMADGVSIEITDDGVGLNASDRDLVGSGHYGLSGIRERVRELGAEFSLDSRPEPDVGVRARLLVPARILTERRA
ncbi:MAG: histidine kinase [Actinomyces sp.]|uniref:sensor histidine kinase n=1 Tax=Actinomyces sp. TaxID=29317 RepID=UPI0026DCD68E|nr:ATP-binding protein [Actinomyces sp.]MDO4242967.1 histidine kinase [Actinomyces sp.]